MTVATRRIIGVIIGLGLMVTMAAVPATAQYGNNPQDLQTRIDRLERELQDLQRYTYQAPPSPNSDGGSYTSTVRAEEVNLPATAILSRRVDDLELSLRGMTGEIERLTFRINQLSEQFERVMGDVDYRLRALEGNLGPGEGAPVASAGLRSDTRPLGASQSAPVPSPNSDDVLGVEADLTENVGPPSMSGAGQPQLLGAISASRLSGSEDADFEIGMQLLRQGDFTDAETTFQDFISAYPSSGRAGEAHFWLGESRFVRGEYARAATAYLTSARDYGGEEKAPDSLLKLGMSLSALGQVAEACSAFDQVAQAYPNASDRVQRNVARERASNNCR